LYLVKAKAEPTKPVLFAVMSIEMNTPPSGNDSQRNSPLHGESQAGPEESLKRKWLVSEKAAQDIGFERALTHWIIEHRYKWRENRSR
jgi:hypothetical protein